jgi:hypothetical protein
VRPRVRSPGNERRGDEDENQDPPHLHTVGQKPGSGNSPKGRR